MSECRGVLAVVDQSAHGVAVWHVCIDSGQPAHRGRLCGSWLIASDDAETLTAVTVGRSIMATHSGDEALASRGLSGLPHVGVSATWAAIEAHLSTLQRAFDAEQNKRAVAKKLIAPEWPTLPPQINLEEPPTASEAPEPVRVALGIARRIDALCAAWERLDGERLARPVLRRAFGSESLPLPVRLTTAHLAGAQ